MNKQFTLLYLCLSTALLLGSCRRTSDEPEPADKLLNTRWMLTQIDTFPVGLSSYSLDYNSYIQFTKTGNQVQGLATCDALQGQFTLVSGTRQLTISKLNVAQSSCAATNFANRYLAALPQTSRYEISGDLLQLYDTQATQPRLIFQAAP
jgi:heat shock protein HslJ